MDKFLVGITDGLGLDAFGRAIARTTTTDLGSGIAALASSAPAAKIRTGTKPDPCGPSGVGDLRKFGTRANNASVMAIATTAYRRAYIDWCDSSMRLLEESFLGEVSAPHEAEAVMAPRSLAG